LFLPIEMSNANGSSKLSHHLPHHQSIKGGFQRKNCKHEQFSCAHIGIPFFRCPWNIP